MDRYPRFAGQTVLVSDSTLAIGLTAVPRALADDEPTWAVRIGQRKRAERPCPIPHFAPAPAGCVHAPHTRA